MANDYCRWSKQATVNVEAFPGVITTPTVNTYEKMLEDGNPDAVTYNQQIISYINERGYPLLYYPYLYRIERAEKITGEHTAAGYGKPMKIYATMDIKDAPSFLTSYGLESQTSFTSFVHIDTWKNQVRSILNDPTDERFCQYNSIYNPNFEEENDIIHAIEPHPKDLIQLMTYGCDREIARGNRIFEITNVEDEILSENFNNFFGHYVWKLTGVRYRYSFEAGMSTLDRNPANNSFYLGEMGEKGNNQVYDTATVAKMFLGQDVVVAEDSTPEETVGITVEQGDEPVRVAGESDSQVRIVYYPKLDKSDDVAEKDSRNEFDMERNIKNVYQTQVKHVIETGYL